MVPILLSRPRSPEEAARSRPVSRLSSTRNSRNARGSTCSTAGHVRFELRNGGANYPLKGRTDFQGSSRILATETIRVRAATVGGAARAQCQDLGRMLALAGIAARFSAD